MVNFSTKKVTQVIYVKTFGWLVGLCRIVSGKTPVVGTERDVSVFLMSGETGVPGESSPVRTCGYKPSRVPSARIETSWQWHVIEAWTIETIGKQSKKKKRARRTTTLRRSSQNNLVTWCGSTGKMLNNSRDLGLILTLKPSTPNRFPVFVLYRRQGKMLCGFSDQLFYEFYVFVSDFSFISVFHPVI